MYITLEEAKKHLNIDDEFFTDDDSYILDAIMAAEGAVSADIDRPLETCIDPRTGYLHASLRHAILLQVGSLYSHREAVTTQNVRSTGIYQMLINPFRKQSVR